MKKIPLKFKKEILKREKMSKKCKYHSNQSRIKMSLKCLLSLESRPLSISAVCLRVTGPIQYICNEKSIYEHI